MGVSSTQSVPSVTQSYLYAVASGKSNGSATTFRKSGYNGDVDNATEDLWPVGGSYVFPATPRQMDIVSSSADDAAGGTGVRSVEIHYLDTNYEPQSEVVVLNGVTPVATVATNILRINAFHTEATGSGATAAGNVDLRALADTPIYARIPTGGNTAQMAIFTIPSGKTGYIAEWHIAAGATAANHPLEGRLRATCEDAEGDFGYHADIFYTKDGAVVTDGSFVIALPVPIVLPPKTDIKIAVIGDGATSNIKAFGEFSGWYE